MESRDILPLRKSPLPKSPTPKKKGTLASKSQKSTQKRNQHDSDDEEDVSDSKLLDEVFVGKSAGTKAFKKKEPSQRMKMRTYLCSLKRKTPFWNSLTYSHPNRMCHCSNKNWFCHQMISVQEKNQCSIYRFTRAQKYPKLQSRKKMTKLIPVVIKHNALKNEEWNMIENSQEMFPQWVPPPEIHGTKYKDMFEKTSVENFDLSATTPEEQGSSAQDV
jgi:hypothetical protein